MFWNVSYPINTAILHRNIRIQPFCNSLIDEDSLLLLQEFYKALLLGYGFVNLSSLAIKKINNTLLFFNERIRKSMIVMNAIGS